MPIVKPQALKSLKTIELQPDKMSSKMDLIMYLDIAGRKGNDIAEAVGLTASRVSIIRNSPMYLDALTRERKRLSDSFNAKQSDKLVTGDPVDNILKEHALNAAKTKIDLMDNGKSEFVRLAAAGDILDRAGYKAREDKTRVSVEITDKMSDRFEKALRFNADAGAAVGGESPAPMVRVKVTREG